MVKKIMNCDYTNINALQLSLEYERSACKALNSNDSIFDKCLTW